MTLNPSNQTPIMSERNWNNEYQRNSVSLIQDGIVRTKLKEKYYTNTGSPQHEQS